MIDLKIIKKVVDSKNFGLKNIFTHKSKLKNSKCGDKITIELIATKKKFKEMRYETESCILCQASASIISKNIKSYKINEFLDLKKEINDFFKKKEISKNKSLKIFDLLLKNEYINRKEGILLPFDAISKAIK